MKVMDIIGRYTIIKRYDKAYKKHFYDITRGTTHLFTYNRYTDAVKALNSWIEVNGKY